MKNKLNRSYSIKLTEDKIEKRAADIHVLPAEENLHECFEATPLEETRTAFVKLNNGKAAEPDDIAAEAIKEAQEVSEWVNWLFNVTINDISVIYVTAHRYAGGLKKKSDLRSSSQRHRHLAGFFNVPVLSPTRDHPFYTVIPTHRPI